MRARAAVVVLTAAVWGCALAAPAAAHDRDGAAHSLRSPVTDEDFYFVMADRFENGDPANDTGGSTSTDRLVHGFDPKATGFYNGGDLKGLLKRIDYIRGLGTDSIWLTPSFKNKAVQLEDGPSAGYHGYWITDFTQIDPHLGTNDDLRALIEAAHRRGMKVYFDIITNHTADVIGYEGAARRPYISKDDAPYKTAAGTVFDDRDFAGRSSFPALSAETSFPYKPVLEPGEETLKVPSWLNDLTLYHNRGNTTFVGEDSLYGDFAGLDDLFTEDPRVVQGMIDVYETWIRDFGVDGFRIDTMKHVDDAFWQRFGPEVLAYARAHGKREFFMFGEVFDTTKSFTSRFTTQDRMQAVIDFPFQAAAQGFAADSKPADALKGFFEDDDWYTDADSNVYQLPTFLGNHDMGRIGFFVARGNPGATDAEQLARDRLAHELMYFSRGNPVIYYGDEQGFTGSGGDQVARQTLFASQVPQYLDDDLIGTTATHAQENFVPEHPLYRAIGRLDALTERHDALRDGAHQHRYAEPGGTTGVYAFSRIDRRQQREYVVALNNAETAKTAAIPTYAARRYAKRVYGEGQTWQRTNRARELTVIVPPLSAVVYKLDGRIPRSHRAPSIAVDAPAPSGATNSRMEVAADVGGDSFYEVTFHARVGRHWTPIGTDDTAPYRVFHDVSGLRAGTPVQYKAVVLDNRGHTRTSRTRGAQVPPPALTWDAPGRGLQAARRGAAAAVRRPRAGDARRHVRAQRRRRPVDGGRERLVLARVLAQGRLLRAGAGHGDEDRLPGHARRARRDAGDERGADDRGRATADRHRDRALLAREPRRVRELGPAPVGRRGRPRGARAGRVGQAVAGDAGRGRLGRVRDPARGRHQGGELHHAQARRGQRAGPRVSPAGTARSSRSTTAEIWLKAGDPTIYTSQPATP